MKIKFIFILFISFVTFISCNEEVEKSILLKLKFNSTIGIDKPFLIKSADISDTLYLKDSILEYSLNKFSSGEFLNIEYGRVLYPIYLQSNLPFTAVFENIEAFKNRVVNYEGKGASVQANLLEMNQITDLLFVNNDFKTMDELSFLQLSDSINKVKLSLEENIVTSDTFLIENIKGSRFYFDALLKTYYLFWHATSDKLYQPKNNDFLAYKTKVSYADDELINNVNYIDFLMIDLESELYGADTVASKSSLEMLKLLQNKETSPKVLNKLSFNITERHIKANKANDTKETVALFKKLNNNVSQINEIEESVQKVKKFFPGEKAPVFDFETPDHEKISLSDLKGKLVYLDFWATWCAPCRKEIPFLKQLEQDYKDENIEFVSISIDNISDYEQWKLMIKEKEMSGIQLFAGNETPILEAYGIQFIPRFVLIDASGNYINSSAPKPSSLEEIRSLIDNNL